MMLDGEAGAELEHPEGEYLFRRCVFEEPYTDVTGRGMLVAINSSGVKTEEGYFRTLAEREALRRAPDCGRSRTAPCPTDVSSSAELLPRLESSR
jgi:hypothetical protein